MIGKLWQPLSCFPNNCFCEAIHPGWIAQPSAVISMIPFLVWGILLITAKHRDHIYQTTFGLALLVTGLGSMLMHATFLYIGGILDWLGIFMIILCFLYWAVISGLGLPTKLFLPIYIASVSLLVYLMYHTLAMNRLILLILTTFTIGIELLIQRRNQAAFVRRSYLYLAILIAFAAFIIHQYDEQRIICQPESLWQLHSLWHLLTFIAVYFFYRYKENGAGRGSRTPTS